MENLNIAQTKYTPEVVMKTDGYISFTGKTYPENTFEFYAPVSSWLKEFFATKDNGSKLTIDIAITYFNSSSSKFFFDFFDILDKNNDDFEIVVNWIFDEENEGVQEAGEDLVDDFSDLKINLVIK